MNNELVLNKLYMWHCIGPDKTMIFDENNGESMHIIGRYSVYTRKLEY